MLRESIININSSPNIANIIPKETNDPRSTRLVLPFQVSFSAFEKLCFGKFEVLVEAPLSLYHYAYVLKCVNRTVRFFVVLHAPDGLVGSEDPICTLYCSKFFKSSFGRHFSTSLSDVKYTIKSHYLILTPLKGARHSGALDLFTGDPVDSTILTHAPNSLVIGEAHILLGCTPQPGFYIITDKEVKMVSSYPIDDRYVIFSIYDHDAIYYTRLYIYDKETNTYTDSFVQNGRLISLSQMKAMPDLSLAVTGDVTYPDAITNFLIRVVASFNKYKKAPENFIPHCIIDQLMLNLIHVATADSEFASSLVHDIVTLPFYKSFTDKFYELNPDIEPHDEETIQEGQRPFRISVIAPVDGIKRVAMSIDDHGAFWVFEDLKRAGKKYHTFKLSKVLLPSCRIEQSEILIVPWFVSRTLGSFSMLNNCPVANLRGEKESQLWDPHTESWKTEPYPGRENLDLGWCIDNTVYCTNAWSYGVYDKHGFEITSNGRFIRSRFSKSTLYYLPGIKSPQMKPYEFSVLYPNTAVTPSGLLMNSNGFIEMDFDQLCQALPMMTYEDDFLGQTSWNGTEKYCSELSK